MFVTRHHLGESDERIEPVVKFPERQITVITVAIHIGKIELPDVAVLVVVECEALIVLAQIRHTVSSVGS